MKKFITIVLVVLILAAMTIAFCACNDSDPVAPKAMLRTDGVKIVDGDGVAHGLYGTNLGGWLVQESWLVPTDTGNGEYGQIDMMLALANRFGLDGMNSLLDVYEDNWVTELDFERIKQLGFNCVRIPFTYLNLTDAVSYDENTSTYVRTPFADLKIKENAFVRLDWALDMCDKYGLYAILDMHGAVGSQSGNDHSGDIAYHNEGGLLWNNDETGAICREKTKELWVEVAKRYKDRTCVAMYDLLNEPGVKILGTQITTVVTHEYHDELYKAIREVDRFHIICMESCWTSYMLPDIDKYGWENVVYEYHHYNWASQGITNQNYYASLVKDNHETAYNVPVLIGEFNVWPDSHEDKVKKTGNTSTQTEEEAWSGAMQLYCGLGWNFTTWNFKHAAKHSSWGIFNYDAAVDKIEEQANYLTMSKEDISTIWARHNSENYIANTSLINCIIPHIANFRLHGNDLRSYEEILQDGYYILTYNS